MLIKGREYRPGEPTRERLRSLGTPAGRSYAPRVERPRGAFVRTEVAGLTTLHLPARGSTCLTLHVGVGWADETFSTRGVTHAIEHLVMGAAEPGRFETNGCVTAFQTAFWANGPSARVGAFLERVAAGLRDLPLDRLERERRVLAAETLGRSPGPHEVLLKSRFGNEGPGLGMFPGLGPRGLEPDVVAAHRARWFVAGNAVLSVVGPMPDDLDVHLPEGRPPVRTFEDWRLGPAWDHCDVSDPCLSLVAPDVPAASVALRVMAARLERVLRHERGAVYGVSPDLVRLPGTGQVVLQVATRSVPEAAHEVAEELAAELRRRATTGTTPDEVAEDLEWFDALEADADNRACHLQVQAERLLAGMPAGQLVDIRAAAAALAPGAVAEVVSAALPTAMVLVPHGCAPLSDLPLVPTCGARSELSTPVLRRRLRARVAAGAALGFAGDVVQYRDEDGDVHEVRFDECVGVGVGESGGRLLFGRRGCFVWVDPQEFRGAAAIVRAIDDRLPAELRFPLP